MNMLIKGNERRVVIVKGKKDSPYEMACIFLKEKSLKSNGDIVRDAEAIIHSAETERIGAFVKKRKGFSSIIMFLSGFVSGLLFSVAIYVLITICS